MKCCHLQVWELIFTGQLTMPDMLTNSLILLSKPFRPQVIGVKTNVNGSPQKGW